MPASDEDAATPHYSAPFASQRPRVATVLPSPRGRRSAWVTVTHACPIRASTIVSHIPSSSMLFRKKEKKIIAKNSPYVFPIFLHLATHHHLCVNICMASKCVSREVEGGEKGKGGNKEFR